MSKVIPGRTEREAKLPFDSLPIHHGVSLDDLFALDDLDKVSRAFVSSGLVTRIEGREGTEAPPSPLTAHLRMSFLL